MTPSLASVTSSTSTVDETTHAEMPNQALEPMQPDPAALWETVQQVIKQKLSAPSFETWIAPLQLVQFVSTPSGMQVTLSVESKFNLEWIQKHYKALIDDCFAQTLGTQVKLIFVVQANTPSNITEVEATDNKPPHVDFQRPWTPRTTKSNLNPRYTFNTFVVGQNNRFPHAAALAIAEAPAQNYNPFFVYGAAGLGKTHLVQAIGHYILQNHPELQVKYTTAEHFTNGLINALGAKAMKPFRDKYRNVDVLMIDDIQFLEGKERTQEEIFHTFNTLHSAGKQIILTSDRPAKLLNSLEERLRSRFAWGLMADITPPDLETRVAILQKKAETDPQSQSLRIPDEVFHLIAERFPDNVRELEGALNKVLAYAILTKVPLTYGTAEAALGKVVRPDNLSLEKIIDTVAHYYHLKASDIKGTVRAKDIAYARKVAAYLARTLTDSSFPRIGQAFGNKNHTTMLYAYEKIKEEREHSPVLSQQLDELTQRIKLQMP